MRRMLLDLSAQLGHVLPTASTPRLVQLLDVALGLLAFRGVLCRCKLQDNMRDMTLLWPWET